MTLYFTLTAEDTVLSIHQSLVESKNFANQWHDRSGANRTVARIVSAPRDRKCIYSRSNRFKTKMIAEEFAL